MPHRAKQGSRITRSKNAHRTKLIHSYYKRCEWFADV